MVVPKIMETRFNAYMQAQVDNNNNMCNSPPYILHYGVTHVPILTYNPTIKCMNRGQNPSKLKRILKELNYSWQWQSHISISAPTLARWQKSRLTNAGIDTAIFKVYSVRGAAASAAANAGITTSGIRKAVDWSSESSSSSSVLLQNLGKY